VLEVSILSVSFYNFSIIFWNYSDVCSFFLPYFYNLGSTVKLPNMFPQYHHCCDHMVIGFTCTISAYHH